MKILKKTIWLAICSTVLLVTTGCENGKIVFSDEERQVVKDKDQKRGVARKELFVECMELAAKMPRQSDDDVADIVEECRSSSYYMTNYMR